MKRTTWSGMILAAAVATVVSMPTSSEATRYVAHATVTGPVAVRVWVDGGDVFPDYNHVALRVRPDRDCYTSLFLVDTAGFIHVLNVGGPYNDGWLRGGREYAYRACDIGIDRLDGRGIAYVFAVGSPVPFDYSYYGASVYVGGFGFRVVGDPFVGCREFYMSLLPAGCRWDYVGVSYTRFYVREWVRYPSYLCAGGPGVHVHVGDACRTCAPAYASYRCNVAAPYEVIRPTVRYKDQSRHTTEMRHVVRSTSESGRHAPVMKSVTRSTSTSVTRDTRTIKTRDNARVVSTSREIARTTRAPQPPKEQFQQSEGVH